MCPSKLCGHRPAVSDDFAVLDESRNAYNIGLVAMSVLGTITDWSHEQKFKFIPGKNYGSLVQKRDSEESRKVAQYGSRCKVLKSAISMRASVKFPFTSTST